MWLEADGIPEVRVCEMVYRLEGDQHGVVPMVPSSSRHNR